MIAKSNARYRFEFRLATWAEQWVEGVCGSRVPFFVGLREDGSVRRAYFSSEGVHFTSDHKEQLAGAYAAWFLYVPHTEGGAYIEWLGLPQATVERWIGRRLETSDFLDVRSTGALEQWPSSWRVVVV